MPACRRSQQQFRKAPAPTRVIPFRQRAEGKRAKKLDAAGEKRQHAAGGIAAQREELSKSQADAAAQLPEV